jgi:NNP family nitrate/nitrite transporter-like MFS transporter
MQSERARPEQTPYEPFRSAFPAVALIAGVFFFNFLARLIPAPFLVDIEREFGATHAQAGSLFLFLSLGVSVSLAASGFAARSIGHRGAIIASISGVGGFLILSGFCSSLAGLKTSVLLLGLALGLYLPSGISTITSLLDPKDWGKGLAVHETAPNLAFIAAPAIAAALEGLASFRIAFAVLGAGALVMALAFALLGKGGRFRGEAPRPEVVRAVAGRPQFWILAVLFSLAAGATFGTYSMLPLYLVSVHGLDAGWANQLLSLSRVPCLVMALSAGVIIDRLGSRGTILFALGATGVLTGLLGLLRGAPLQTAVLVQAMFAVCFFPAGFTAISTCFPVGVRNVAISLIVPTATLLGTGATPALLGWFGDHGRFPFGFVLLGAAVLLGMGLVLLLDLRPGAAEPQRPSPGKDVAA